MSSCCRCRERPAQMAWMAGRVRQGSVCPPRRAALRAWTRRRPRSTRRSGAASRRGRCRAGSCSRCQRPGGRSRSRTGSAAADLRRTFPGTGSRARRGGALRGARCRSDRVLTGGHRDPRSSGITDSPVTTMRSRIVTDEIVPPCDIRLIEDDECPAGCGHPEPAVLADWQLAGLMSAVFLCGKESGIPGQAATGRVSIAFRASSPCVGLDPGGLDHSDFPGQREGQ